MFLPQSTLAEALAGPKGLSPTTINNKVVQASPSSWRGNTIKLRETPVKSSLPRLVERQSAAPG
jgi:hypothetical protein